MEILIAVLLAGGMVTLGAQLVRRRREARPAAPAVPAAGRAELEALRPGDVVVYGRRDLVVDKVVQLAEGLTRWSEHALRDEGAEVWLVLHPADPQHALLGRRVTQPPPIPGEPPESLDLEGHIFRLCGAGQARAESLAPGESGCWDHWEYDRPGAARVWIRRVGAELRVCAGERVARHLLEVLPAADEREGAG